MGGLEEVPLFKLDGVLLVHALCALEECIPIKLGVVLLLDECDGLLHDLAGKRKRFRLIVDHCEGRLIVGHSDTAALEH